MQNKVIQKYSPEAWRMKQERRIREGWCESYTGRQRDKAGTGYTCIRQRRADGHTQIIECSVGRERGQGTAAEDEGVVEHRNTLAPTEQVRSAQGARWNIPGLGLSTAASHTTHLCFSRATQHKNRNCSTAGMWRRVSNVAVTAKTPVLIVSTECDTLRCQQDVPIADTSLKTQSMWPDSPEMGGTIGPGVRVNGANKIYRARVLDFN